MADQAAAPVDYHGRPRDAHHYRCKTCQATMSTDNLPAGLVRLWKQAHEGHETEEEHLGRYEPCTGMAASWCPNCGDCTCPVSVEPDGTVHQAVGDDAACPLHGPEAAHA